ncbi:MAG TPA: ABC transporter permease [Planctomycetota bacterium]|nr:ABC transporter permease [Planctomycetota bacterium]
MKLIPWDYAVRNLGRNKIRLVMSIGGAALVALLVLGAAAFVSGMQKSMHLSGVSKNVLLIGAGSEESLERSEIGNGVASIAAASIEGLKTQLGVPYVSPEVQMATIVKLDKDGAESALSLFRGVTPTAFLVHPQVRITEGRAPGTNEILVGRLAAARMGIADSKLAIGKSIWFEGHPWLISGRFEAPNTVMEAELWTPLKDLQIAARRDNVSTVVVTLDEGEIDDVRAFCAQRLDLELVAVPESEYYSKLATFYKPVQGIVWITAFLIALGGLFGGLNTMYAAFAARTRELGMLQVLGYGRVALIVNLMQESLIVATAGGLLAVGIGFLFLDGLAVRITMGAFGLSVDAGVILAALGAALALGVVGALPPAWQCMRMPIAEALKK